MTLTGQASSTSDLWGALKAPKNAQARLHTWSFSMNRVNVPASGTGPHPSTHYTLDGAEAAGYSALGTNRSGANTQHFPLVPQQSGMIPPRVDTDQSVQEAFPSRLLGWYP